MYFEVSSHYLNWKICQNLKKQGGGEWKAYPPPFPTLVPPVNHSHLNFAILHNSLQTAGLGGGAGGGVGWGGVQHHRKLVQCTVHRYCLCMATHICWDNMLIRYACSADPQESGSKFSCWGIRILDPELKSYKKNRTNWTNKFLFLLKWRSNFLVRN